MLDVPDSKYNAFQDEFRFIFLARMIGRLLKFILSLILIVRLYSIKIDSMPARRVIKKI